MHMTRTSLQQLSFVSWVQRINVYDPNCGFEKGLRRTTLDVSLVFAATTIHKKWQTSGQRQWEASALDEKSVSTHSSFKYAVVDVVSATLRAGERKPLAVFVALLIGQLDGSPQQAVGLLLSLVLLLRPELSRVQTWDQQKGFLVLNIINKIITIIRRKSDTQMTLFRVMEV